MHQRTRANASSELQVDSTADIAHKSGSVEVNLNVGNANGTKGITERVGFSKKTSYEQSKANNF